MKVFGDIRGTRLELQDGRGPGFICCGVEQSDNESVSDILDEQDESRVMNVTGLQISNLPCAFEALTMTRVMGEEEEDSIDTGEAERQGTRES